MSNETVVITQREALAAITTEVAGFRIRDRGLLREQQSIEAALAREGDLESAAVSRYLTAVERYFLGFHREARTHLQSIDKRLESLAQLQFNAAAEHGVAARRVEITQTVLTHVERLKQS